MKMLEKIDRNSPPRILRELNALLQTVFGFNFERWHQYARWPAEYTCYGIFEGERLLANAGVFEMDLRVKGCPQPAVQLGAVATRPEVRGQGLSRRILEHILALYPGTPMLLCANQAVVDFYPRFGFTRLPSWQARLSLRLDQPGVRMHRLAAEDPALAAYVEKRAVFSRLLDCRNAAPILYFHLLHDDAHPAYEIPELGCLLVAVQRGAALCLQELVATRAVTFAELVPYLGFSGVKNIQFGFNPDWLGVKPQWVLREKDLLFQRAAPDLPEPCCFPELLRT
jgi:GNAT superfamily N-acetyltransferase